MEVILYKTFCTKCKINNTKKNKYSRDGNIKCKICNSFILVNYEEYLKNNIRPLLNKEIRIYYYGIKYDIF